MINLGTVRPGTTIYVPFQTFDSNDPSASVTITGLATTDIEIYKDGSVTQRASDAGYTLLDTDGIDFDSTTGIHGVSIDLADNTTANFYEAGSQYWVVIASITVDAATINFVPCLFTIGYENAIVNTTIATLSTQTGFTLEDGSADNDAYNGCPVVVHDLASAIQVCVGYISDYVGSTKTVTLSADPGVFTMAAGDNISIFLPANVAAVAGTAQTAGDVVADTEAVLADTETGITERATLLTDTEAIVADTNELQTDWADAGRLDAILDAVLVDTETVATVITDTEAILADTEAATAVLTDTEAILADTNELQTDWADAGRLDAILDAVLVDTETVATVITDTEAILADTEAATAVLTDTEAILADTNELQTDWADAGRLDAILDSVLVDTEAVIADTEAVLADTEANTAVLTDTEAILTDAEAIVAKTDQLAFGVANQVDANVESINTAGVVGDGNSTPWDGA